MTHIGQEELERRILQGLAREWDLATAWLPARYKAELRPPLFALVDMGTCWGRWTGGGKRELALSRELVLKHRWDAVVDVLRHELAHQLVEEVLGAGEETVHGATFHRACELVSANPAASGGFPPLDERVFAGPEPQATDRLLLRIRKLLALAGSPNPHEAEHAMRKAHDLIERYNVDLLAQDGRRDYVSVFLGRPALRHAREEHALANLLMEYYFVRSIWASAYVLEHARMGRVLEISGTVENVRVAHYIYDFVGRHIEFEWLRYQPGKAVVRGDRSAFAVGVLSGFAEKLRAQRVEAQRPGQGQALVKVEDPQLKDYFSRRYPHITRGRGGSMVRDEAVFEEGRSRGRTLVIHRGVDAGSPRRGGRLLAARPQG